MTAFHGRQHATYGAEHAQRQHVDLHQAQRVDVVLVPLDHRAFRHGGVLHRHQAVEPAARNDEAADMLRQVPWHADQHPGYAQPALDAGIGRVEADFGAALRQFLALFPPGQVAGQAFDCGERKTQGAAGVAQRAAGAVADHGGGQRRTFATVPGIDVLDHFFAPLMLEIDVDVGWLVALLRDEAFEQHRGARRVDLGDEERIADRRVRRRTPPLAEDALPARPGDDVVHGKEIGRVAHFGDQPQFVLDLRHNLVRHAARITPREALRGQLPQPGIGRLTVGHDFLGIFVAQFVQGKIAARNDLQRLGQQLGRIQARQRQALPQVALAVRKQGSASGRHRGVQAQGGEHILQRAP